MRTRAALLGSAVLFVTLGSPLSAVAAPRAGGLAVAPAKGTDQSVIEVETTGPCPVGTNLQVTIYGRGFPAAGQRVVSNSRLGAYNRTAAGGYVVPLAMTLRDFVNLQPNPVPLAGDYRLVLICRDNVRVGSLAEFVGSLTFSTPRTYTAAAPVVPAKPFGPVGSASPGAMAGGGAPAPFDSGGARPEQALPPSTAPGEASAASAQPDTRRGSVPGGSSTLLVLGGLVAGAGVAIGAGVRPRRRVERAVP